MGKTLWDRDQKREDWGSDKNNGLGKEVESATFLARFVGGGDTIPAVFRTDKQ